MSLKNKSLSILGTITLSACLLSPAVANAQTSVSESATDDRFVKFLETNGVSEDVQMALQDKVASGKILDSAKGGKPVSESVREDDGYSITTATYPDGSITVITAQIPTEEPEGTIVPFGTIFTGCSATGGSGWATYKGCNVQGDNGQAFLKFQVDYEKYSGAYAQILRSYNAKAGSSIGWKATGAVRDGWKPKSSIGNKAHARYHTEMSAVTGQGSYDFYTGFYLDYKGNWSVVL